MPSCIDPQQPQYHCAAQELAGGLTEASVNRDWAETFIASARAARADVTYRPQTGGHWYTYAARMLNDAIRNWGLFRPVPRRSRDWTYKTASQRGKMWGLRFRFTDPPEALQTFTRDGDRLRGGGDGSDPHAHPRRLPARRHAAVRPRPADRPMPPSMTQAVAGVEPR